MHINVWFSVKDGINEDIIEAIDWDSEQGEYPGAITPEQIDVFSHMADRQAVQPLFLKNQNKTLWSTSFTFPDLPTDPPVVIVEPPLPPLPDPIGPRPVEPPIPVDENGEPLYTKQEWQATQEWMDWDVADKAWKADYKVYQKAYDDAMKPWYKEVADLKAVIKKQSDAFAKTDTAVQQLLSDLPNDLELLGAWFMDDGAQAMPLSNDLIKYMPDVPDTIDADGNVTKWKKATELTDVNLLQGQAPRDFS